MRWLLVVALMGCGGDSSPYDVVECGASWDAVKASFQDETFSCERACEETPPGYGGSGDDMRCLMAINPDHENTEACTRTFDLGDGERGCCLVERVSLEEHRARLWTCAD